MELRKSQLAAAVGAALLVGGTAAQAQVSAGQQGIQVQLYGQVNRALMHADNETQGKLFHVDGQPSSTRFGLNASAQAMPGLRIGARIETEMKSNPSNEVTFATPSQGALAADAVGFAERWLDLFFEGSWGRINMGQGSGAADDASTIDLSGTALANGAAITDWGGGIPFTDSAGAPIVTAGAVLDNLDFESRYDRVMYTTPVFGGFRAQVGVGQKGTGEVREASLWWSGKLAGTLQAAVGWSEDKTGTATTPHNETIGGSISWLHTSGFNVTAAYTRADLSVAPPTGPGTASDEAKHYYGKVGYKFGQHAISLAYFVGEDQALVGDEAKAYALGYVWNPIAWAEIYANAIMYQLDHSRPGVGSANDITVYTVGSRIRF